MKKKILLFFICFVCAAYVFAQGNRYYVRAAANGFNNGQSWTDAFTNLHDALVAAQAGDEVWVAAGAYSPGNAGDRSARYSMLSGVRLYGGFAGTEMLLDERDPAANATVLEADIGLSGDSTDNSYNLLYLYRPDSNTVVDGLTFRNAVANDPAAAAGAAGSSGAALYIMAFDGEAYPVIRNCIFEKNTAQWHGGAVYVNGGGSGSVAPLFEKCRFSNNQAASGNGGALCRMGGSWLDRPEDITGCVFEQNAAYRRGGAIFFEDSERSDTFDIAHTLFRENSILFNSVNLVQGSCIQITTPRANGWTVFSLRTSIVTGHTAGVYPISLGYNLNFHAGNLLWLADSVQFINNYGGGGIEVLGAGNLMIQNALFDNSGGTGTTSQGGSPYAFFKNIRIQNRPQIGFGTDVEVMDIDKVICKGCTSNNGLIFQSGGMSSSVINARNLVLENSNLLLSASKINLFNSTFNGKFKLWAAGSENTISNCIFNYQSDPLPLGFYISGQGGGTIDHCILSTLDTFTYTTGTWVKTNNLWATDPLFVDAATGDFRLQACSPAINAGANSAVISQTDFFGNPRIRFDSVDIGAVEMGDLSFEDDAPSVAAACPGGTSGRIDASGLLACQPVQYSWDAAPANNSPVLAGLSAGSYTLHAVDAKGRSVTTVIEVSSAAPVFLPTATPLLCGDTTGGTATAALSPAAPPLQFLWAGGSTDSLRTGLAAGSYPVTVTDAEGCSASGTVVVDKTGSLSVDIEVMEISCHGNADGAFTVLPANGKTPFAWLWDDGQTTPTIGPLGPGSYAGTLTDALGCTIQWLLPLNQPGPLLFSSLVTNASDSTAADGRIELMPSGGTAPYEIVWNTGTAGPLLDSLPPGLYTATLTDAHGCVDVESFAVGVTSATGEVLEAPGFALYPNPAIDRVWLQLEQPAPPGLRVRVLDTVGRETLTMPLPEGASLAALPVLGLPRGMYAVTIGRWMVMLVLR